LTIRDSEIDLALELLDNAIETAVREVPRNRHSGSSRRLFY